MKERPGTVKAQTEASKLSWVEGEPDTQEAAFGLKQTEQELRRGADRGQAYGKAGDKLGM